MVLSVQNLRVQYGARVLFNDLSFTVEDGERIVLAGHNGAGKSTLVRCINLLETPTEGEVIFDGRSMTTLSRRELLAARQKMGMIFQSFNLLSQRTALGNVLYPLEIAGADRKSARDRARQLLGMVGLADKENSYPSQLSGGQKQRLCIARTLLKHPKVLIFDDSTSAVDTATESGIRHALAGLGSVTKLIIAQRITSVQSADLIVILDDGRLHAVGTHDELLAKDTIYQEIYHSQMKGGDADGEAIRR